MKGIIVPRPVFDGPSSFIPKSDVKIISYRFIIILI